ncbi:hypothetical protein FKP32DRAFT_1218445 [Trametes sanguinea]|nr:hypothetical protein FKP32DRAFT_1218445 [Trametes sanguinea]
MREMTLYHLVELCSGWGRCGFTVFELAALDDQSDGAKLCGICRTVRSWLLPLIYDTVLLTSSKSIQRFAYALMEDPIEHVIVHPAPASIVRNLWIGPTSSVKQNDLTYHPSSWPVTLIHQILARCKSLRSFALINLYQNDWFRLASVLPPGLESLTLGPVHGKVDWRYLPCARSLRTFTSMDTYMLDLELQQIVVSPNIRTVRRFYSRSGHVALAFDQLQCVEKATGLQTMEIVCCAETVEKAKTILEDTAKWYKLDPERIVLVPKSHTRNSCFDPISVLFEDWSALTKASQ